MLSSVCCVTLHLEHKCQCNSHCGANSRRDKRHAARGSRLHNAGARGLMHSSRQGDTREPWLQQGIKHRALSSELTFMRVKTPSFVAVSPKRESGPCKSHSVPEYQSVFVLATAAGSGFPAFQAGWVHARCTLSSMCCAAVAITLHSMKYTAPRCSHCRQGGRCMICRGAG